MGCVSTQSVCSNTYRSELNTKRNYAGELKFESQIQDGVSQKETVETRRKMPENFQRDQFQFQGCFCSQYMVSRQCLGFQTAQSDELDPSCAENRAPSDVKNSTKTDAQKSAQDSKVLIMCRRQYSSECLRQAIRHNSEVFALHASSSQSKPIPKPLNLFKTFSENKLPGPTLIVLNSSKKECKISSDVLARKFGQKNI